jgi:hypothetical protein
MAERARSGVWVAKGVHRTSWAGLTFTTTDTGAPTKYHRLADKNVTVHGTFGAAGSVTLEGSNDQTDPPTNWFQLQDVAGNAIALTAANPTEQVLQNTLWYRPRVTAGDGTTNLSCQLVAVGGD